MPKATKKLRTLAEALDEISYSKAEPPKPPNAEQVRTELKKRGINAWEAFKCCLKGRNDASRFADETADALEWWYENPPGPPQQASVIDSVVLPATRFIRYAPKGPATGKFVAAVEVLEGTAWVNDTGFEYLPGTETELKLATEGLRAVAKRLRTQSERLCYDCIKRKLWKQSKKRKWFTPQPLRKGPRTRDSLCLRVPHQ